LIEEYASRQARMPVAVVIGGDPAVQLAAAVPMPAEVEPLGLAGLLREKPLDAVACRSVDLLVPAEADFVLEGYIDPAAAATHASPRFSPTGRILAEQSGHAIQVTALTHRANRIFPAVAPDTIGCNEICLCQKVLARSFLALLKLRIPELVDLDLPLSGGARHVAFLAIRKAYAGQARQTAAVAWGMRPFCWARLLVIFDAEIDVRSADEVWAAIARDAHPVRDVWLQAAPPDPLDPTSIAGEATHRLAIDATRKFASEGSPSRIRFSARDDEMEKQVTQRWAEYGLGPEEKDG
jgi:4-hydroxy-3-polyprenylbenzoate decarboxylase